MKSWALQVISIELRKAFSYRVDFWLNFLSRVFIVIGVSYFLWTAIYAVDGRVEIAGFTLHAMLAFFTILPMTDRIVLGEDLENIATEIYDGGLTKYLVYPTPYFRQKYLLVFSRNSIAAVQYLIVYGVAIWVFRKESSLNLSWSNALMGLAFTYLSGSVYFLFKACIEQIAFWADNVWSLLVMLRFSTTFLGGGLIPLELFPEQFREATQYLPFPYLIAMPIQIALGRAELSHVFQGIAVLTVWGLMATYFVKFIWRKGLKQYSGVGI